MLPALRLLLILGICAGICIPWKVEAQSDTFFLARKKGILGRIGRSISTDDKVVKAVKTVDPFLKFAGHTIASIQIESLGLDWNMSDSVELKKNFFSKLANKLHKDTKEKYIRNHLFFREGDVVVPLMLSDNERFLREQVFLQDAWITLFKNEYDSTMVDVTVITRDVFSLGGAFRLSSIDQVETEVKEENVGGSGNKLSVFQLYDKNRSPSTSFGAEVIKRNIGGNFLNWRAGFKNFSNAFNNQRKQEISFYTSIERPLVSRYTRWTGAFDWAYNQTQDNYNDSLFKSHFQYRYLRTDLWGGYNIGARRKWMTDNKHRLRHFVALRTFYTNFYSKPSLYQQGFNYNYADINGALISYTLYKQNFYKTNFIYGFGRNEDVPVGISASTIMGWTNKDGRKRNYFGLSGEANKYSYGGNYYAFNARAGGFTDMNGLEDVTLLLGIEHFTALRRLGPNWRNRNFINLAVTQQHKNTLNSPLFLESEFGLPYYRNGNIEATSRNTVRAESVFYNLKKVLGFRFAPFVFGGISLIKPVKELPGRTGEFTAFGGGFRTRNENLILGTIEVKGYVFSRKTYPEMKNWRIDFSTNLKFKYNSSFIKRPDFVVIN